VLSALLTAAERSGAGGAAFLEALVAGCETAVTLANVLNHGHYERGWHPTAVVGTVGAAAGVGVLHGLDADRLRHAVGVAASGAGGLKANFGTMTKPYHVGAAARTGLEAADLAAEGFTANPDVLEASFGGFCDLFEGDPPHDFADHLARLGDPWKIRDPPVAFKPYPCCGSAHAAIDAALALRSGPDIDPASIDRVQIVEHPRRLDHTDRPHPDGGLDAKFSVQYCVAVALRHGDVWLEHFEPATVEAEMERSLVDRVTVRRDADRFADMKWGAEVRVRTADGTERTGLVPAPRGSAENPLTSDELEEKYRRCLGPRVDEHDVQRSVSLVRKLDTINDVRTVIDSLTGR
jgi:2-methylcitrate dehydratase PrpD